MQTFGGVDGFVTKLQATALGVFGSGWAWLSLDAANKLSLDPAANQDSPLLAARRPLLCVDVWEHAYYLKYQNRRAEYLKAIPQRDQLGLRHGAVREAGGVRRPRRLATARGSPQDARRALRIVRLMVAVQ